MIGVQLVGLVFLPALIGGLVLLVGAPLTPLAWLPVIGLLSIMAREQSGRSFKETAWRAALAAQLVVAGVAFTALFVASAILDTSWDGQAYHLRAVLALSEGWNPVWDLPLRHYLVDFLPKSAWVVESLVLMGTGSLEGAKGIHITMIVGAFALWYAAAANLGLGRRWAMVVSLLIAANPIAINQSLTFYVDGLVASTLSVMAAVVLLWWHTGDRLWLFLGIVGFAFLANLKFNGLALAGLAAACLLLWVAIKAPQRSRGLMGAVVASMVCAGIQGINPYLTNTLRHGHPLHPLMGGVAEPGIELIYSRNAAFLAQSPPRRLIHSIAARATNDSEEWPRFKAPFSVDLEELTAFTDADTRIGGWGPLFSGCLVLSALLMAFSIRQEGARVHALLQAVLWLFVLPAEQSFWARYSAHLWLTPAFTLLLAARGGTAAPRFLRAGLAIAMTLNVVLACTPSIGARVIRDLAERRQLEVMAQASREGPLQVHFGLFGGVRQRLADAGVVYREQESLECDQPARLPSSTVEYCLGDGRSPAPAQRPIEVLTGLLNR